MGCADLAPFFLVALLILTVDFCGDPTGLLHALRQNGPGSDYAGACRIGYDPANRASRLGLLVFARFNVWLAQRPSCLDNPAFIGIPDTSVWSQCL